MAKQTFQEAVKQALSASPTEAEAKYEEKYEALKLLAFSIQQWFSKKRKSPVEVFVEPGYQIDVGQQFNMVLQIAGKGIRDTLFRAYLSPDGKVSFDFYGEELIACDTVEDMQTAVETFLSKPEVRSRMRVYKDLLTS